MITYARCLSRPQNIQEHTKQYQLKKWVKNMSSIPSPQITYPPTFTPIRYADATLGSGNLRAAVVLPEGEDLNEWLAVNS